MAAVHRQRFLSAWFCPFAHRAHIALEHTGGASVALQTSYRIAGCDLHEDLLLVWSGRQVFVYRFDASTGGGKATTPPVDFSDPSPTTSAGLGRLARLRMRRTCKSSFC